MADHQEHAVLIVEDDPAIRRLVTMVLKREGYRLEVASDGLEAVEKIGLGEYDAIVLDLMMPNLDGFAFVHDFAADRPERLCKVIITSAASPTLIRQRLPGDAYRLLPKPFDLHELLAAVRACIDGQN